MKDLKGNNDVDKAKVFLQKTCKVNFLDLEVEWRYINTIRKIRNKIIHHQSSISTVDNEWKELSDFIFKNNDKIGFDEYVNIMTKEEIDEKYGVGGYLEFHIKNENLNLEFIEIIKRFYRKLLIQIGVNQ